MEITNWPPMKFNLDLHREWKRARKPSAWQIWKDTGVAINTAKRYIVPGGLDVGHIEPSFVKVARYLGVEDWRECVTEFEDNNGSN